MESIDVASVVTTIGLAVAAISAVGAALLGNNAIRAAWNAVRGFVK